MTRQKANLDELKSHSNRRTPKPEASTGLKLKLYFRLSANNFVPKSETLSTVKILSIDQEREREERFSRVSKIFFITFLDSASSVTRCWNKK